MNEIVQFSTGQIQLEKSPVVLRLRNAVVILRITRAFAAFVALVNGILEIVTLCLLKQYGSIQAVDLVRLICSVLIFFICLCSPCSVHAKWRTLTFAR